MKFTLLILVLLFSFVLRAQTKIWNNWYFGYNAGLSFNTNPPTVLTDGLINSYEGCASISDEQGNLLFYTDGVIVWDKNHAIMPNGTGLKGDVSTTQSAVIVPYPDHENLYYLFTMGASEFDARLFYSIVDLNKNAGIGEVDLATKNTLLLTDTGEKQTAIAKPDGSGYWFVASTAAGVLHAYSITSAGLNTQSTTSEASPSEFCDMKFSSDGKMLAFTGGLFDDATYLSSDATLQLYSFNHTDGTFALFKSYTSSMENSAFYSVEFSPDSKKLYTTQMEFYDGQTDVLQFDLEKPGFTPETTIATSYYFAALTLAPDNKIYVAAFDSYYLACINNPNGTVADCGFVLNAVELSPRSSAFGLPAIVKTPISLMPEILASNACTFSPVGFRLSNTSSVQSILWNFGDGETNTSLEAFHSYENAGVFKVSVTILFADNSTKVLSKEITIYPKPKALIIEHR